MCGRDNCRERFPARDGRQAEATAESDLARRCPGGLASRSVHAGPATRPAARSRPGPVTGWQENYLLQLLLLLLPTLQILMIMIIKADMMRL